MVDAYLSVFLPLVLAPAATLTPEQQAGQRVIYSYSGTTVPQGAFTTVAFVIADPPSVVGVLFGSH